METKAMRRMYRKLSAPRQRHSEQVARLMEERARGAGLDPRAMYLLGKYHDIGYAIAPQDHAASGAMFLEDEGFPYHAAVLRHEKPFDGIPDAELRLLCSMNLVVDSRGGIVGAQERLDDIARRCGASSDACRDYSQLAYQCGLIEA